MQLLKYHKFTRAHTVLFRLFKIQVADEGTVPKEWAAIEREL